MSAANPRAARAAHLLPAAHLIVLIACLAAFAGCTTPKPAGDAAAASTPPGREPPAMETEADTPLKAVSFNIRYPNRDDGPDYWGNRRHRVVQTLQRLAPDVFGLQEAYEHQVRYLLESLPGYHYVGVGRDDGEDRGEMTAVCFSRRRFVRADHGHLWLSDTPDVPGSVGWDASMTRMATWIILQEREGGRLWLVVNTHFDHRGPNARAESAKLLARFIHDKRQEVGGDLPAILMGDFNSGIGSAPYRALTEDTGGTRLFDSYRVAARRVPLDPGTGEGTFNGFRGRTDGARIDWVLVTGNVAVLEAGIDRVKVDGRTPSDHDPVWAVLRRD